MYEGKLRVRSNGILIEDNSILLVNLRSPITDTLIWTAPGGGVEFGETTQEAVIREFEEETGLLVRVHQLLHINELIEAQFHAVEFYYKVEKVSGMLKKGSDPERSLQNQLIKEVKFINVDKLNEFDVTPEFLLGLSL